MDRRSVQNAFYGERCVHSSGVSEGKRVARPSTPSWGYIQRNPRVGAPLRKHPFVAVGGIGESPFFTRAG